MKMNGVFDIPEGAFKKVMFLLEQVSLSLNFREKHSYDNNSISRYMKTTQNTCMSVSSVGLIPHLEIFLLKDLTNSRSVKKFCKPLIKKKVRFFFLIYSSIFSNLI
jgi:hypothetical protein